MLRLAPSFDAQAAWFVPRPDDQPIDAWLKRELAREYEATLKETLPQEWLDLLREDEPTRH